MFFCEGPDNNYFKVCEKNFKWKLKNLSEKIKDSM